MVVKHHLVGYENFLDFFKTFDTKNKLVYVYFTGTKGPSGDSWCPDCNSAWPVVANELSTLPEDCHFVVVEVGDRETWKDQNCPFRKDPKTRLLVVPTLKRWNEPQKLEGEQCENADLVNMLFTLTDDD
ncbi:thioredoxin domain-containing protein 17-like [Euwallacea fornicatus]|uniref:thioredoxin domain-containing protein 17-like n=1 Tax=Euwallacea fornicatus TaxID=995702 RepID=UPI00338EED03